MAGELNLVRFNPTLGGLTDWVFSTIVPGHCTPSQAGAVDGKLYKVHSFSADGSQWELSEGAYTAASGTFARTTILYNSSGSGTAAGQSGAGTKINFTAVPQCSVVLLKEDLLLIEEANAWSATQQQQARNNFGAPEFEALAFNNLIINGGMEVDQQHVGASGITPATATSAYAIDQWAFAINGTMVCTAQQATDAPPGFSNSFKITVGTAEAALAAGDYAFIFTPIEGYRISRLGYGAAGAQTVTLGFYTKTHRTGTYSGAIRNSGASRSYPFTFTQNVADTWEYKTVVIPGDVAGTWLTTNGVGLTLAIAMASGTTFAGTANTWAASNLIGATGTINGVAATTDVFQITGVSLMPGNLTLSSALAPNLKRPFDQELLLCQRFYEKSYDYGVVPGSISNIGDSNAVMIMSTATFANGGTQVSFKVTKRATPTLTGYSPATGASSKARDLANSADVTPTADHIASTGFRWFAPVSAPTTTCAISLHWAADARL